MYRFSTISLFALLMGCNVAYGECGDFIPVDFRDTTICVSPDYYQVDGVRTPMGLSDALRVAEENNAFLPTPEMVDAIWEQADVRLDPIPMTPGSRMTSVDYYVRHDAMIDDQLLGLPFDIRDAGPLLIAGHKKDIVQPQRSGRVTIYGWHRSNGRAIQPVSSVHGSGYYDYSHGVRLIRYPE
jgi:hypothetical protein